MTAIDTSTEAVERLAKHIKSTCGCALGSDAEQPVAETLHSLLKERDEARARAAAAFEMAADLADTTFSCSGTDAARIIRDAIRALPTAQPSPDVSALLREALQDALLWTADNQNRAGWRGKARAALAASQPADPVTNDSCFQPVRVKPLAWVEIQQGRYYEARVIGILYSIRLGSDGVVRWQAGYMGVWHEATTLEAAKAAAQADYEGRILAAIEPAPVTLAEAAKVQALVDAGERMTGPLWRLILADENCIKNPCDLPTCECRQKFDRIAGPWFAAIAALKDAPK